MADCKRCGEFFQATPDEERLIATHHIEEICMDCARAAAEDAGGDFKPEPLMIPEGKYDGTKLHRAEKFDKDGKLLCFLALPLRPLKPRHKSLRKPRKGIIHVGIISSNDMHRMSTQPRVILHTNIKNFRKTKKPLWISKIPGFWDAQTGVSRIEVQSDEVDCIVGDLPEKEIRLKDGGFIRLIYK